MTSSDVVRPAVPGDVSAILGMIRGLAEYERLAAQVRATEERLAEDLFGARPWAEAMVAEVAGDVVGYALYFHTYSTFLARPSLFLEDLFVEPAHRRRGLGHTLIARLAALAVERGCARLDWSVLEWNASALAFYQALGARAVGEWQSHRLEGAALEALAEAGRGEREAPEDVA